VSLTPEPLLDRLKAAPTEVRLSRLCLRWPEPDTAALRTQAINAALPFLNPWVWWTEQPLNEARVLERTLEAREAFAQGRFQIWHLWSLETGAFLGGIDLHSWDLDVPRCQLGYWALPESAGQGLLTEACRWAVDWAFAEGVARIEAFCDSRNHASHRMAQRLGMQREGILHAYTRDMHGELEDEVVFAITRAGQRT
jgi:RimJ/RimL family protein N-acetyltransferase